MTGLRIRGGAPLSGSVRVHGAKNSVLPILAATLLSGGVCVLHNCPKLTDVTAAAAILRQLGCDVKRQGDTLTVDAARFSCAPVPEGLMREMRSSILFLGAMLGRCGQGAVSLPGGCRLGPRPIDLHLQALRSLGVTVEARQGRLLCRGRPKGARLRLRFPSVGATENILLCACTAEGTTILENPAREPEIEDLQNFLRAMGADIRGAGTKTMVIRGVSALHGAEHRVISDRIVAASCLSAAAATGGRVRVEGVDGAQLRPVLTALERSGCTLSEEDGIVLSSPGTLNGIGRVTTAPYPGFPTDAQPLLMAALCAGRGLTCFEETLFENRYRAAPELCRMGADIRVKGRLARVRGVGALRGAWVQAPDLRGAAALVTAALCARGESVITGVEHLDRGYASLEEDLRGLGAEIQRIEL